MTGTPFSEQAMIMIERKKKQNKTDFFPFYIFFLFNPNVYF